MNVTEGAIPISIGTSMALETIVVPDKPNPHDPDRKVPKPPIPVSHYNTLHINVLTLIRNMLGAMENPYQGPASDVAKEVDTELGIIAEILPSTLTINLFTTDMKELQRKLPTFLREVRTDKQKAMRKRMDAILSALIGFYKGTDKEVTLWGLRRIPVERDTSLIITHEPVNLIHKAQFKKLHLLESHTGVVKTEKDFYTKMFPMPGLSLERIPFEKELLVIFGDKVTFKPLVTGYRKAVFNLAKVRKWTTLTTASKINKDMKLLNNQSLHNTYNDIKKKM